MSGGGPRWRMRRRERRAGLRRAARASGISSSPSGFSLPVRIVACGNIARSLGRPSLPVSASPRRKNPTTPPPAPPSPLSRSSIRRLFRITGSGLSFRVCKRCTACLPGFPGEFEETHEDRVHIPVLGPRSMFSRTLESDPFSPMPDLPPFGRALRCLLRDCHA